MYGGLTQLLYEPITAKDAYDRTVKIKTDMNYIYEKIHKSINEGKFNHDFTHNILNETKINILIADEYIITKEKYTYSVSWGK